MKQSHRVIQRTREYGWGDCYLYKIHCKCGEVSGGWTPDDAETSRKKHLIQIRQIGKLISNARKKGTYGMLTVQIPRDIPKKYRRQKK